jgi:hypothetical protein
VRDTSQLRNYRGLKLASWLVEGSYWVDTQTENQVMNLIERTLNNKDVDARWPHLNQIDVDFPQKGVTAWAERKRGGKGLISLPVGTRSPLIVLHEVAHLLPTVRPEADHGPGFTAIHMMLVELMYPKALRALTAAYHATGMTYDFSQIPPATSDSTYIPITAGVPLRESVNNLRSLMTSGVLTKREHERIARVLKQLRAKSKKEDVPPLMPIPTTIEIPTESLLKCLTSDDIAALAIGELRREMLPDLMKGKPLPKKR